MFCFKDEKTLLSYCPKKNKLVLLLSTFHHTDDIDPESGDSNKPYILTFYNSTKGGVDTVDEYKSRYSVSRTSNRWPLTIFFSLLNIAGINSFIILRANSGQIENPRKNFLKSLSKELCEDYLRARMMRDNLPRQLKRKIQDMMGARTEETPTPLMLENGGPGRCYLCDWKKNRKTKTRCGTCTNYICKEHTTTTCTTCSNPEEEIDTDDD
jgi:hypothetical protein